MLAETAVSEFRTQRVVVGMVAEPVAPKGSLKCYHGVRVKADKNNVVPICIGYDDTVLANGFALEPGDEVFIAIDTPEKIWAVSIPNKILYLLLA